MSIGKLYCLDSGELIVDVDYQVYSESSTGCWGELVFTEYRRISDGARFSIELEDGRRGHCSLQKRVNRAVSGLPALYHYQFRAAAEPMIETQSVSARDTKKEAR